MVDGEQRDGNKILDITIQGTIQEFSDLAQRYAQRRCFVLSNDNFI